MVIQIRWFQYRIIRRVLLPNTFFVVEKLELQNRNYVQITHVYPETLNHLFWGCEHTSEIWEEIYEWIKELSGIDIYMNEMEIIIENNINAVTFSIYYTV